MFHHQNAGQNHNIKIANKSFKKSGKVHILQSDSNNSKFDSWRSKRRLKMGNACCHRVQRIFYSHLQSKNIKIKILSCVWVTYKMGFGLVHWIYGTLYIHNLGLQAIQRNRWFTHFTVHCCTLTRVLSLQSHILATDLSQSHCHFKSHMKSTFHSLTPFLPLFCSCQFRRFDIIQFLISLQAAALKLDSSLTTSTALLVSTTPVLSFSSNLLCPFIIPQHGPPWKIPLYC
jgi:hypothetical protein